MKNELPEILFSGIVAIRDKLLQHSDPIRMESGDPDFDTPEHIKDAMYKALKDNKTHYAPSTGLKELREAIVNKLNTKNSITNITNPNSILVTNGGMHGLFVAWNTILNPGDEVIVPTPNWTASTWNIILAGGKPQAVKLHSELEYRWNIEEVKEKISAKTKAILINTPHNPSGGMLNKSDLIELLKLVEKHNFYLISDEAYEDVVFDGEHVSIAALVVDFPKSVQDNIISCFTFSKSYAMTGWRLGYLATTNELLINNMKKLILYTINGVSTPTQYAGLAALKGPQDFVKEMCDTYHRRRDLFFEGVNKTKILHCESKPHGSFYLYPKITDEWDGTPEALSDYLIEKYGIGSIPGKVFFDSDKVLRFTFACSDKMIKRANAYLSNE
jgi:aspartate aminotransferase